MTDESDGPETLTDAINPLVLAVDEDLATGDHDDDIQHLLTVYADAKRAAAALLALAEEAEAKALPLMPKKTGPRGGVYWDPVHVDGYGTFFRNKPGIKTEWADNTLDRVVARAREMGMINGPDDVAEVIKSALYAGMNFRVKFLGDELGMKVDDFRETQYGPARLRWQ